MKTPAFWKRKTFLSCVLMPFGWVYGGATWWRIHFSNPWKAPCPVFCVGNLTAGGVGKTPVCLSLVKLLQEMGKKPFILSRGYGGTLKNVLVDPKVHTSAEVGDEPLLLSKQAPVVVHPDRSEGARLACALGADCLVMDDGFQNPTLFKDVSFLVFEGAYGVGNGLVIPSGPLRESFQSGIKRAQAVVMIGHDEQNIAQRVSLPTFHAKIKEVQPEDAPRDVLAFAGIGHPEKFYASLEKCGFHVVETFDFPDHHFYTREELTALIKKADAENLALYTTTKDFVKIPSDLQSKFRVLEIEVAWDNQDDLLALISAAF